MSVENLFEKLWKQYSEANVQALQIHNLLRKRGEEIVNDHIALRTFGLPKVNIDVLSQFFLKYGYEEKGTYEFKAKKLRAKHFEKEGCPRVFISELNIEDFSPFLQATVASLVDQVPLKNTENEALLSAGLLWEPVTWEVYEALRKESEYAAWLAAFGYVANHFTISVNQLTTFKDIFELNSFVKDNGFDLNVSGGEIKGDRSDCLLQSSTLASERHVALKDGEVLLPGCYYEFAERFHLPDGSLFNGFIAASADKIFESTDLQE
jgi:hypothetical protein